MSAPAMTVSLDCPTCGGMRPADRRTYKCHLCGTVCNPTDRRGLAPLAEPEPALLAVPLDIFGGTPTGAPAVRGSETSEAAAERVDVPGQTAALLRYVIEGTVPRPFTDDDLIFRLTGKEYAPGKRFSPNSPRARRVDAEQGPLKRMTDGTWQRVEGRGGYVAKVGEAGGRSMYDITDKALAWYRRGQEREAA